MEPIPYLSFPPFRINLRAAQLEQGDAVLSLRPKAFALLHYVASRPGELLTKENLLDALWPGRIITEGGLSELVRELRSVLGDDAKAPRFIETVHGRGYRFIARPSTTTAVTAAPQPAPDGELGTGSGPVGREAQLAQLAQWYALAASGTRQLVFITGEPGIGKTTVVDAFNDALVRASHGSSMPRIGRGQCIEQYGAGEAYLPVLDALGRLARQDNDVALIDVLRQHAPSWLVQLPALLDGIEIERLERRTMGATRDRMMREMAEALEVLTTTRTLVLVLEDVHWSDYSTLDLISFVAQRKEYARLMIVATFRPVELYACDHPLKAVKQELETRGQCLDMPLPYLSETAVGEYLARRFADAAGAPPIAELAPIVHQRTDGHPLFMVNVADYVSSLGFSGLPESVLASIPHSVRQMIEKQIDRLGAEEQRILEVAAAAGFEFSAASVAAGLETEDIDAIENACADFARRGQFLVARGSQRWPDGTVAGTYGFIHALYQNVLYFRVAPGRRARLHQRIGLREERAWLARAVDIAGELAAHFEAAQDYLRALDYLALAGDKAARRGADREAIELITRALNLLVHLDDPRLRDRHELHLSIALGVPLIHARGYASAEVAEIYGRARELHTAVGEPAQLFLVLWGLWLYEVVRGEHSAAYELGRQLQALERDEGVQFPLAHYATGCSQFWLGDFHGAIATLDHAVSIYNPEIHGQQVGLYSQDPKAVSLLYLGWARWILGYPDQAMAISTAAAAWADALGHPFSLAFAHNYCAVVLHLRREGSLAGQRGEAAIAVSAEHGFPFWEAWGLMMRGKALVDAGEWQAGIELLNKGLAEYEATGAAMGKTLFFSLLAEAYLDSGQYQAGLSTIAAARAFADASGEDAIISELYRLEGELLVSSNPQATRAAETSFLAAIDHARRQRARSWELRAATSLARLWQSQGKREDARALLAPVYAWFEEGDATRDLGEARALLASLHHC